MKNLLFSLVSFIVISYGSLAQPDTYNVLKPREGREGVYLFLTDQTLTSRNSLEITDVIIYRSVNRPDKMQELGHLRPATSPEDFERICGTGALSAIMKMKNLPTAQDAWMYLQNHSKVADYGILALDVRFLEAMGTCFVDRDLSDVRSGSTIYYRVDYIHPGDPARKSSITGQIKTGMSPAVARPMITRVSESDTAIYLEWRAPAAASAEAMFGEIWRRKGNQGAFEKVGLTLANTDTSRQWTRYTWRDKVEPRVQYLYYLLPFTQTWLAGPVSDTAYAISASFFNLPQTSQMAARDTLSGIYLSWTPPEDVRLYKGLVIERRKNETESFRPVDTIPASAAFYLDTKVLPNLSYYYRLRWLTLRDIMLPPAAYATGRHSSKTLFPEAPEGLTATVSGKDVHLSWFKHRTPDTEGYYVYRDNGGESEMMLISNLLTDTVFTDTTLTDGRKLYKYAVLAVNYDNLASPLSSFVFARPEIKNLPLPPAGLRGAMNGQKIMLVWNDSRKEQEYVTGYYVYRAWGKAGSPTVPEQIAADRLKGYGFSRLMPDPVVTPSFSDLPDTFGMVCYAVTCVDELGNESPATTIAFNVSSPEVAFPSEIYLRRIDQGVEISWDRVLDARITGFEIYRRIASASSQTKIGFVSANQNLYIDTAGAKGELYFYSVIPVTTQSIPLIQLPEKGIRF